MNELRKLEKPVTRAAPAGAVSFLRENSMTSSRTTFMDYNAQIQHLKNKNLIIEDDNLAIYILSKIGYYGLINEYKDVFKDTTTNRYIPDTTFDDIYQMYLFDAALREVFLKYILIVEKNIKSSISYHFSNLYGNNMTDYQNSANYDYGKHQNQVRILFKKINQKIYGKNASPQVKHHLSLYHDVPLWVLTTDLTLGEIATMYRYLVSAD